MPGVSVLRLEEVREAVRLLGRDPAPASRASAERRLRELLGAAGAVPDLLERAPDGARDAFVRLAEDGPAPVEELLGRGWWGRGTLPPPLNWLQRRALVVADDEGLVHATQEAVDGWRGSDDSPGGRGTETGDAGVVRVSAARCVVVAESMAALQRALSVSATGLRAVAPTVAVSDRQPAAVTAALRGAGVDLLDDPIPLRPSAPALPGTTEEAAAPKAVRALLERAVADSRQVWLRYFPSSRGGAPTERVVDPWRFADDLLVGWCHLRTDERTFAVDRIGLARLLPTPLEHPAP